MAEPNPSRRRRFRFRLRTMLLVVALIALPLAWTARERGQSRYEQQLAQQRLFPEAEVSAFEERPGN